VEIVVIDTPPQLDKPAFLVKSVDGEPVTFELPAATAAPPYVSDDLTYRVIREPLHGVLQGSGRQYTFTPDRSYCGIDTLMYVVEDPCGARSYGIVELVAHLRPTIHGPSEVKAQRRRRTTFDVLVYDPCGGFPRITVTADSGSYVSAVPVFLDSKVGRWSIVYTPPKELSEDILDVVRVTATSGATGLTAAQDVHVTVVGNRPPQASPPHLRGETTVRLTPGGAVRGPVAYSRIEISDPDGDQVFADWGDLPRCTPSSSACSWGRW